MSQVKLPNRRSLTPIWLVDGFDQGVMDRQLVAAFQQLTDADFSRRSHYIKGRFENLYLESSHLPGLTSLLELLTREAAWLLDRPIETLHCGFWLNAMQPGDVTSRHSHDENDELLSCVYYVQVPRNSGDIVFHDTPFESRVRPESGMALFFSPDLEHSVEPHQGQGLRLSVACNFGPAEVHNC